MGREPRLSCEQGISRGAGLRRWGAPVHADLKAVIELQQLDLRIADLNAQIDALPDEIRTLEAQLAEFIHAHEERKQRLAANQKERRDLEGEIQTIRAKISKHKDQLYEVKTNEQYRAMLREIEGEEKKIAEIEDRELEKMLEAEQLEKHIQDAAARLESETGRVAKEVERLKSLRQVDFEERDRLVARRKELEGTITRTVLETYENIRKMRRGLAVAVIREGFCTACNVRLRPQVYNEILRNESVLACDNCDRILYYEPPPEAAGTEPEPGGERPAASH